MSKPKSPLSGMVGGSDFNSNNRNNNNGNGSKKSSRTKTDSKEAKEYFVRKFSGNGIPLAEQIMIGGRSFFLQIIDGKPKLSPFIDLSKEKGMILIPNHTVGSASPIIEYEYNDLHEIEYFIDRASRMKIDDLYFLVKSIIKDTVATNEKELIVLLATDTIMTFFQDLFVTTHYVVLTGPPGWGKGAILVTLKILGYRVVLAGDMSGANLLDLLGPIEKCQVTLCEDEFDKIHDDPDKERIYKMGYEDVGSVTRTVDPSSSDRRLLYYNPYCMKFFASEKGPDSKELGGFNDRLFRAEAKKGQPKRLIKEIKKQMERTPDKQLPKYRTIISRINFLRKVSLIFRLLHHADTTIEEVPLNIADRALELCGPAIRLFNCDQLAAPNRKALNEVMAGLSHYLRKKGQLDEKVIELVIHDVLIELFNQMDKEEVAPGTSTIMIPDCWTKRITEKDIYGESKTLYIISYDEICNRVMKETEGSLISPRTFESPEYGRVSHDSILSACRSLYCAKPDRITKGKKAKALSFDKDIVISAGKNFEVISEIKILNEEEQEKEVSEDSEDKSRWDEWTNGRDHNHCPDGGNDDLDSHSSESKQCTSVPFFRPHGEKDNISTNTVIDDSNERESESKEGKKGSQCTNIGSSPPNDEKLVHWYTGGQNHAQVEAKEQCTNIESDCCDLRNQEGADRFKAEVERLSKSKSKLADAAQANLSGNGLLDRDNDKTL